MNTPTLDQIPADQINTMLEDARASARQQYPSPLWHRVYNYPNHYPPATSIRNSILDGLGLFLAGVELWRKGVAMSDELGQQTASFMVRHKAYKQDFPAYLVTPTLTQMLMQTDKLEAPNVDKDSKPPFDAAFFVLPRYMIGMQGERGYVTSIGYALLDEHDCEGTPVRFPESFTGNDRRLYVAIEMSSGTGYYAKLEVAPEGNVQPTDAQPYEDLITDGSLDAVLSRTKDDYEKPVFEVTDGPALLEIGTNLVLSLCTYLNMDSEQETLLPEQKTGIAKQKRNKSYKEFWSPAVIGVNLTPSGVATQGTHASPHAHLRRGHFRRQHFGKNREEVRRVWIKPVLVMGKH